MGLDLQVDSQLSPQPNLQLAALESALRAVEIVTNDERLSHDVCLRVCDEAESQQLNNSYRGKNQPTNVLSFPAEFDQALIEEGDFPLGDIAICWPVVCAEAKQQEKNVGTHFTHLFVHGLLHLLGFDHQEDAEADEMEALEVKILRSLNISNPYESCH